MFGRSEDAMLGELIDEVWLESHFLAAPVLVELPGASTKLVSIFLKVVCF